MTTSSAALPVALPMVGFGGAGKGAPKPPQPPSLPSELGATGATDACAVNGGVVERVVKGLVVRVGVEAAGSAGATVWRWPRCRSGLPHGSASESPNDGLRMDCGGGGGGGGEGSGSGTVGTGRSRARQRWTRQVGQPTRGGSRCLRSSTPSSVSSSPSCARPSRANRTWNSLRPTLALGRRVGSTSSRMRV